jgi:nascent polypeptide-associated complex subunit alpha
MMPGGLDPKKMQAMMKQMGIKSEELDASRVVIETAGHKLVIENPNVVQITMQGTRTFQISGDVKEESPDEDIRMIMEQANCTKEQAAEALKAANGDIAQAIISLTEEGKE